MFFQRTSRREAQPKAVIAVKGAVVAIDIAMTKRGFKGDVRAVGAVVMFKEIVIAGDMFFVGGESG